jgi:hypothetical protein
MCRVSFTENLKRHVPCPPKEVAGDTVAAVLRAVFADNPELEGYILDDQCRIRRHVTVFINDAMIKDRDRLTDPVRPDDEVFVFQALSGG